MSALCQTWDRATHSLEAQSWAGSRCLLDPTKV